MRTVHAETFRPEDNPFLQQINAPLDEVAWGKLLRYNPLKDCATKIHSYDKALEYIERVDHIFVPTHIACEVAAKAHRLLWNSLVSRDPRRRVIMANSSMTMAERAAMDWSPITPAGLLLQGIARQGKTHLIERMLQMLPRAIDRGNSVPGYLQMTQLVHLCVPMPPDRSIKSFLLNAATAMDAALGTDEAKRFNDRVTAAHYLDKFVVKLRALGIGWLVIEEAQEKNGINHSKFGTDFINFFIRMLNEGIVLLVAGNPMAFSDALKNKQLMTRLARGGIYNLDPCLSHKDDEFFADLLPGFCEATIFAEPDEPIENLAELVFDKTAAFRHLLPEYRKETLRIALDDGATRVLKKHVLEALEMRFSDKEEQLVRAFRERKTIYLDAVDIPTAYFAERWRAFEEATGLVVTPSEAPADTGTPEKVAIVPPPQRPAPKAATTSSIPQFSADDLRSPSSRRKLLNQGQPNA